MSKLANKVALVTGGSRASAAAIAKRLAADGASRGTYAKDASAASAVVKAIELAAVRHSRSSGRCRRRSRQGRGRKDLATFGRLDVLVNNRAQPFRKRSRRPRFEEMDRVIDITYAAHWPRRRRAEVHEERRSHHHDRLGRGRACPNARTGAYSATRGRKDVCLRVVQGGREPGYHGQQRPAGSDRHGFESRRGRLAVASEGRHSARPLWACDEAPRWCRSSPSGVLVHYRANLTVDGGMNA